MKEITQVEEEFTVSLKLGSRNEDPAPRIFKAAKKSESAAESEAEAEQGPERGGGCDYGSTRSAGGLFSFFFFSFEFELWSSLPSGTAFVILPRQHQIKCRFT